MGRRICFVLDLVTDDSLIQEYEQRHAPGAVWPEVVRDLHDRGFESMEIWRMADRLVMVADVRDDYPCKRNPSLQSLVDKWETEMSRYQKPVLSSGPKWAPMQCIFKLSDQTDLP